MWRICIVLLKAGNTYGNVSIEIGIWSLCIIYNPKPILYTIILLTAPLAQGSDFVGLVRSMMPIDNDVNDDGGLNQRRDRDNDDEDKEDDGGRGDIGGSDDTDTTNNNRNML